MSITSQIENILLKNARKYVCFKMNDENFKILTIIICILY